MILFYKLSCSLIFFLRFQAKPPIPAPSEETASPSQPSTLAGSPVFTGTSWGTYAIVTPICVQMALNISGGALTPVVYAAIAAVMGGGCFGDHCSPLSDTTILSSLATGSDHIDHVTAFFNFLLFFSPKCIIFGKSMIFCIKSIVFDKFFIMSYLK